MIEVDKLRISFGDREVVKGVSFNVPKGGSFGIVGESGSGKSTILRAMAGLNNGWTGRIGFGGQDVPRKLPASFFRQVQMVFQDPFGSLHPRQTIDRILSELLLVHGIDDIEHRIEQALADVALPKAVRFRFPHQLSGGQRQRVAIAAALSAKPGMLIADEATSALDMVVQAEIVALLDDLVRAAGMTLLFITHDVALASGFADRVAIFRRGALVETGPTRTVLAAPAAAYTKTLIASHRDLATPPLIREAAP